MSDARQKLISLGLGLASAVVLHFMLFRISVPLKPFIYAAF